MTTDTMRAALLSGPEQVEVVELPIPRPGPADVLVRVEANAVCGTDVKAFLGKYRRGRFPTVLGHEIAGTVHFSPDGAGETLVGRRVCVEPNICCQRCRQCKRGLTNLCPDYHVLGESSEYQGGCAEFIAIPRAQVHVLPEDMTAVEGALVQPFAISHEAVAMRARVEHGERVLVVGAGPIGLSSMMLANLLGAEVMVVDTNPSRVERARELGARHALLAEPSAVQSAVLDWTEGEGVDVVVEAVGGTQSATLELAQRAAAARGRIVVVGGFTDERTPFPVSDLKNREQSLIGSHGHPASFEPVLRLFGEGMLRPADLVSHTVGLEGLGELLAEMATNDGDIMKGVITPKMV